MLIDPNVEDFIVFVKPGVCRSAIVADENLGDGVMVLVGPDVTTGSISNDVFVYIADERADVFTLDHTRH